MSEVWSWANNAVYASRDGGATWRLVMYFPANR